MATTLKLPPALKRRIARAAKQAGKSAHAFMVEAIVERTTAQEERERFVAEALEAERELDQTRLGYSMADVQQYVKSVADTGQAAAKPRAKQWRK